MKLVFIALLFAAVTLAADSPLAGTWEGEVNGQPAVRVVIEQKGDTLKGRIAFVFQERGPDGAWRVKDPNPEAGGMLAVKVEGKSIRFEVRHHKQHGGTEWGPNVPFRIVVTGAQEARLFKLDEGDPGQGLKMTRK